MVRSLLLLPLLAVTTLAAAAPLGNLKCASKKDQIVYGDPSQVLVRATAVTVSQLADYTLTMSNADHLGHQGESSHADPHYKPRNPRYQGHLRFASTDSECVYQLLLPSSYPTVAKSFTSYLQMVCDEGFTSTVTPTSGSQAPTTSRPPVVLSK
jgi:hypothetical protein